MWTSHGREITRRRGIGTQLMNWVEMAARAGATTLSAAGKETRRWASTSDWALSPAAHRGAGGSLFSDCFSCSDRDDVPPHDAAVEPGSGHCACPWHAADVAPAGGVGRRV